VFVILVVWAAMPRAQQTPEESSTPESPGAESADEQVPEAVPPAEIANRATEAITRLRDMGRVATPTTDVQEIEAQLPEKIAAMEEYRGKEVNLNLEEASPKLLDEARLQWLRFEDTLLAWASVLDGRSTKVQGVMEEATWISTVWSLTAEASNSTDFPEAVRQQIQTVQDDIEVAEEQLRDRQENLLTLQNQIAEQRIAIAATLEEIDAQLIIRQDEIFAVTIPPIWKPTGELPLGAEIKRDLRETIERIDAGLREFGTNFSMQMLVHLLVFLLLALVMVLLNRHTSQGASVEDELSLARALLRHPLAAAGLVSILALSSTYLNAPLVMASIVPIVALPLAAILTPGQVPPDRRRMIYGVLLLSLLSNLESMVVSQGSLRQILLVTMCSVGLVGLEMLRRRMKSESPVIWEGISRMALAIGAPVLLVTLVAAVLGYLPLAELLSEAFIESSYIAYLLLVGLRVVDALVYLGLRTRPAQKINAVRLHAIGIHTWIHRLVRLAAIVFWIWITLNKIMIRDWLIEAVKSWLWRYWQLGGLSISIGAVLLFVLVLWITIQVSRITRTLLQDDILPRANMSRGRSHMISMLVNYSIIGLGFLAALAAAGIAIEQFAIIGGALGVGIGFGLQNVVSNFVSGLILVFERPVQVGDTVEVGTLVGTVRRIGIRSSTIRTFDEAEVIVPNSDLISHHVTNWTLSDQLRRMEVKVGVQYGTDPETVQALLVEVANEHPKVLDSPGPYSLFKGFGDSSLEFVVRFWTSDFGNWIFIASEVTMGIDEKLKGAGITIPFPQRDLRIYSVDPPAPIPHGGRPVQPSLNSEPALTTEPAEGEDDG